MARSRLFNLTTKQVCRRLFSTYGKPFSFEWLNNPPAQRASIQCNNPELLLKYQQDLEEAGIPTIYSSLPGGKHALEASFNRSLFLNKLGEVAEKTLEEIGLDTITNKI